MAALTTNAMPVTGLLDVNALLVPATSGGDDCQTGAGIFLAVKNADASPHTVTLVTPRVILGVFAEADNPVVVAAGKTAYIPVIDEYRNPSTGRCAITYDAVTTVTVAVFKVPS